MINWHVLTLCLVEIFAGIVGVLTLGHRRPNWDMDYLTWHTLRQIQEKKFGGEE